MKQVYELFKAVVITDDQKADIINTDSAAIGYVTDFTPNDKQATFLKSASEPLNVRTLFSREERENSTPYELITKQVLHYIEVYGLGMPGLFGLESNDGEKYTLNFVRGITVTELADMIRELLYANAPIKDVSAIHEIIKSMQIDVDFDKIKNNEARMVMYDGSSAFDNGDDAIRYLIYKSTGDTMLIKSAEVIAALKGAKAHDSFIERHAHVLSQVFNRHKPLILAMKRKSNRGIINKISRMSKNNHRPLHESIAKTYLSKARTHDVDAGALEAVTTRDLLKYLNVLSWKRVGESTDSFVVRNGKVFTREDRTVWSEEDVNRVEDDVLAELGRRLSALHNKNILLDANVHLGLPTSRKQTVGHLPFGTTIAIDTHNISAGIHWRNEWGANDLDLSTISAAGMRVGWGQVSGYNDRSVKFSGDVTNAAFGAMEFMTSRDESYGLFVNIYSGNAGATTELVIGTDDEVKTRWIDDPVIREKTTLNSRGTLLGFVNGTNFIVYQGRMNNNVVSSSRDKAVVKKGLADFWTINKLFDHFGIKYDVDNNQKKVYNYDMTYNGLTYDKLEGILL